jgi:5-methylcytosine-specific restriction endonuclease McrA
MPRKRQPKEVWKMTRLKVWLRDGKRCQSPLESPICQGKPEIALDRAHIDHLQSGKLGTNDMSNLRTLCPVCHALRADHRHQGLFAKLLRQGLLPENWRELVWE